MHIGSDIRCSFVFLQQFTLILLFWVHFVYDDTK